MSTRFVGVALALILGSGCPRPTVESAVPEPVEVSARPSPLPTTTAPTSVDAGVDATADAPALEVSVGASVVSAIPTVAPPIYDPAHKCPTGMAFLEGGLFPSAPPDEEDVKVKSFCLDATEVTERAYAVCVKAGVCKPGAKPVASDVLLAECHGGAAGFEDHPVNCIGWNDAVSYCKSLGKRLPTQLEWLWARRGGARGTKFPWGNDAPGARPCWSEIVVRKSTCAAGTMPGDASPEGVLDLVGNVGEWTSTLHTEVGLGIGQYWVSPDSWHTKAKTLGWPSAQTPKQIASDTGFRCARGPQGK